MAARENGALAQKPHTSRVRENLARLRCGRRLGTAALVAGRARGHLAGRVHHNDVLATDTKKVLAAR